MTGIAILVVTAATAWLMVGVFAFAYRKPQYSHFNHTISELGEVGARDQRLVAFALFLPVGLLLLTAASLLRPESQAAAGLALAIAIGYLVASMFPCDPGSPALGNTRQTLHNLGGAVQYIGGGFALLMLAESWGSPFKIAAGIVLATAAALTFLPSTFARGLAQRIGETCLFGGLILIAARIATSS